MVAVVHPANLTISCLPLPVKLVRVAPIPQEEIPLNALHAAATV